MSYVIPILIAAAVVVWAAISISRLGELPEEPEDLSDLS